MNRKAFAIAAALLAGTTISGAANAGGLRVGFGFPLGSFIAHSNESYDGGYSRPRNYEKPRYTPRRSYDDADNAPVRKVKRAPKVDVASQPSTPAVTTAKLENKLDSDPATTTEIAKTPASTSTASTETTSTTAVLAKEPEATTASTETATTTAPAVVEAPKVEKVATVDKTATATTTSDAKSASDSKRVCRRFSPAIAGLVDVPCE